MAFSIIIFNGDGDPDLTLIYMLSESFTLSLRNVEGGFLQSQASYPTCNIENTPTLTALGRPRDTAYDSQGQFTLSLKRAIGGAGRSRIFPNSRL